MTVLTRDQEEEIEKLTRNFLARENATESSQDKMDVFLQLVYEVRLVQLGIKKGSPEAEEVEADVLQQLKKFDPDDPEFSIAAPVFRRLGSGENSKAVKYLETAIKNRQQKLEKAHSARQSANAKAPRKAHVVDALIEKIVKGKPDISFEELLERLQAMVGNGIISGIDPPGSTIEEDKRRKIDFEDQENKNTKSLKISGLPKRLSRIKKKLNNLIPKAG